MENRTISRRSFVKGLAAGAVSIASLGILSAGDYALTDKDAEALPEVVPAASSGLTFTPGEYSASAKGIASDVVVTCTFDETSMTDLSIDVSGETEGIGADIGPEMREKVLSAQSCNVDSVSGATVTSDAIKQAVADCMSQASGTTVVVEGTESEEAASDWLGAAPEISEDEITETLETEVLVVGCGTGGWIATMTAAQEGAKVLVVEKQEAATGIRQDIGAIDSKLQKETEKDFPEFAIDKMEVLQEIVRYGSGYVDSDLVKVWINESAELVDWLTDMFDEEGSYRMDHEGGIGNQEDPGRDKAYATGHSPNKTDKWEDGMSVETVFQAICDEHGVEWKFSTALVKLELDENGKVTGIIAQDQNDQHYIRINASKGVIMTTGGYATNTDMMLALQPMTMEMKINVPLGSKADGSGIKAMLWEGAQMDPIHESMMFNRASCLPTDTAGYKTNGKWFWFGEQPFLKVNLNGKRFCNESGPYEFMLHSMYMQPYHTYCDIFDSNSKKYAEQFDEVGCCRLFPFDNGAASNRDFDSVWEQLMTDFIDEGYLIKADTLEELAEGLGIPADNFVETVERYNELCEKGVDEDYGKEKHRMTPVDEAPFYGIRTGAWHLTTLDGVRINTDMQVLKEDGTPIEGLYASGDCTGGFFATNYPNLMTGLACGRTMTFARHAAKLVAGK